MVNKVLIYRSPTYGNRPPVGSQPYGLPYVNVAENQFGVVGQGGAPQDLIGCPFFSTGSNYNTGQPVNYQSKIYIARSSIVAGPFNAAQWTPLASQDWVEGTGAPGGGFVNKIRNPKMDVWQRGTTLSAPPGATFGADGWVCANTGATATINRVTGRATLSAMQITGAAGMTSVIYRTHLEATEVVALGGNTCTFQAQVLNQTGSTITPAVSLYHASAVNNFSTTVVDATTTLQSCPVGVWTRVACTWNVLLANSGMGLGIDLAFGALSSGSVSVSEVDFRSTPGLPVGAMTNAPQPELRSINTEYLMCTRYFWNINSPPLIFAYSNTGGGQGIIPWMWFFPSGFMYTAPTITSSVNSTTNVTTVQFYATGNWMYPYITVTNPGYATVAMNYLLM